MSTVPSSYATMVAEITAVEDFTSHSVKSDGAVVSMTAVISAVEERGHADSDAPEVTAQIESTDQYGRSDSAVVTMIGLPSGIDGLVWTDADTALMVAVMSATEQYNQTYLDADTVTLTAVPSGADTHEITEITSVIKLVSVISALDEHTFPPDADTVSLISDISAVDVNAKWYLDADTVSLVMDDPGQQDAFQAVDADTAMLVAVPSGVDGKEWSDADTALLIAIPSGVDGKEWSDADTVPLIGIPSGTDIQAHWYVDADTALVVGDATSADDVYTPGIHADKQVYLAYLNADKNDESAVASGGGATFGNEITAFDGNRASMWRDGNQAGHLATDLPYIEQDFTTGPPTSGLYAYLLGFGDGGAGVQSYRTSQTFHGSYDTNIGGYKWNGLGLQTGDAMVFIFAHSQSRSITAGTNPTNYRYVQLDHVLVDTWSYYVWYKIYDATTEGGAGVADDRYILMTMDNGDGPYTGLMMAYSGTTGLPYIIDSGVPTTIGSKIRFTSANNPHL